MRTITRGISFHHRHVLEQVNVRLIRPSERQQWDSLMRQYHYLGLNSLVGKTLRYVAVFEDCWLALLGWQAAALKCKARDQWIGVGHNFGHPSSRKDKSMKET